MKSSTKRHSRTTPITWNLPEWSIPFLEPARFKSADGGRGSSKSHTFAQLSVMRMANMLPGYPPGPVRIASARQFQNSITESVKVAVDHYIRERGLEGEFASHKYTALPPKVDPERVA